MLLVGSEKDHYTNVLAQIGNYIQATPTCYTIYWIIIKINGLSMVKGDDSNFCIFSFTFILYYNPMV